jgi:hypothetical protein
LDDHCADCGFDGRNLTVADIRTGLTELPKAVEELMAGVADQRLRFHPNETTWSAIEYLGHLRDLMAYHRHIIEQALTKRCPQLEAVDPDASVASGGYAEASFRDLFGQFDRRVERLCALLDRVREQDLGLTVRAADGNTLGISLIARSALHEGRHHLGDLRRVIDQSNVV